MQASAAVPSTSGRPHGVSEAHIGAGRAHRRQHHGWCRHAARGPAKVLSSHSSQQTQTATATKDRLLETFWKARGVFDQHKRQQLIRIAKELAPTENEGLLGLEAGQPLPGIPATWSMNQSVPEISEVSRRLLALHALLGGKDDVDVIWMVVREPRLLEADPTLLMSRLMAMKLASAAGEVALDVVKVAERHPGLLLAEDVPWDSMETLKERMKAWEYGLASDSDPEWNRRCEEMRAYHRQHGDCSVGFREGDDQELARWATKQRAEFKRGDLSDDKQEQLRDLGFEFDEDEAEWLRWFLELARYYEVHGHSSPTPLATDADYLINWCSVQRVAYRCKVLSNRQLALLDSVFFDYSGADPLS